MPSETEPLNRESDIAIVGMGLHVPGADTPEQFWRNLRNGVESVQEVTEADLVEAGVSPFDFQDPRYVPRGAFLDRVADFDPEFFGLGPKEAAIMDPQHRHFLEVCWEALERSGHPPSKFDGAIGVFGGCGMGKYMIQNLLSNKDLVDSVGYFLLRHTGNDKDFLTTRVSYTLNLGGPAIGIQTACSTSLVAVHLAAQSLLSGECDLALAGGVTIEVPQRVGYLHVENEILSPDGHCRAFDHRAEGTIFGSGAGAVAMRRFEDALADEDLIHAVIKGSAVNNDGSLKVGYLAPSVDGQAAAISEALAVAGTPAETIDYVEAHGTGTPMGDPIEVSALTQAFRVSTQKTGYCGLGSVKTNIGHLDTAAGVVSLIKATLALENRELPPSINWEAANPSINFENSPFYVNHELRDWPVTDSPRRAAVNSLGVGGTNAYVVLEEAPKGSILPQWQISCPILLQLSARNRGALDDYTARLADWLRADSSIRINDVAYSLSEGKHEFQQRRVLACANREEAIDLLESVDPFRVFTHVAASEDPAPVFLLPGGGAQYLGMGAGLCESHEVFRRELERCLQIVADAHHLDLRPFLFAKDPTDAGLIREFERPSLQLPAILAIEYSLARLWMSQSVKPKALIGHSMGENTAACLAGVLTLEAALGLVCLRGRLFETVPDGGMLSVLLGADDTRNLLTGGLVLAVENGPELSVVSGPVSEISAFAERLEAREVEATRIPINIAAHSPMLDEILEPFRSYLCSINLDAPTITFISNRTGTWITPEQATDPDYWVEHLRGTVQFSAGLATLMERFPESLLIETGPGSTLTSLAKLQPSFGKGVNVITSLRHRDQDVSDDTFFRTALGRLWASGHSSASLDLQHRGQRIPLPTYAFQRRSYWIEPGKAEVRAETQMLHREDDLKKWFHEPIWEICPLLPDVDRGPLGWLVFLDEVGLGEALVRHLREGGHRVVTVRNGARNAKLSKEEYLIDSDRGAEGYQDLVTGLMEDDVIIHRLLHLWMLTGDEDRSALNQCAHNLERSFYSLFYLFRALGDHDVLSDMHVIAVSNGARQVFDEPVPAPEKATHDGPCMVAPHEYPGLTCTSIDLDYSGKSSKRAGVFSRKRSSVKAFEGVLLQELSGKAANSRIAYRTGTRFELSYRKCPDSRESRVHSRDLPGVVQGGVYLITGGLGGLGLTVAESMALTSDVHLLLVSRSGLIPREEWDQWLCDHGEADRVGKAILQIRRLEALGATVEVASLDITDHEQLAGFVEDVEKRTGPIRGVVHAAGVIHDDLLVLKSVENVETVFAPKIYGTMVLDLVFRDRSLDFMILFSSSSTITAPPGQVDYVAANAYLNAFAASRSERKGERVMAVCWGVWNEVGIAAEATGNAGGAAVPTLHPLLSRRIELRTEIIFELAPLSPDTHWILNEHRLADGRALIPGTAFIELANFACSEISSSGFPEIRNLTFLSPLAIQDRTANAVRMKVSSKDDGMDFCLQSLRKGTDGRFGWLTHGRAELHSGGEVPPAVLRIQEIMDRCTLHHRGAKNGNLSTAQDSHVAFGPRWAVLKEQAFGATEAYALLDLPAAFVGDLDSYALHPALLDIATGHAMELIDGYAKSGSDLWIPVSYERVRVYASLPQSIFSWVRSRGGNHIGDATASFNILIADRDGNVLIDIENFTIQKAPPGDLLSSLARILPSSLEPDRSPAMPRPAVGQITPSEERLAQAVSQGIRASEGMQVFRDLLRDCSQSMVIVSSLDLDAMQEQGAEPLAHTSDEGTAFERPQLDSEYVEPATADQLQLAELWQDLLGIGAIGIRDSFFDLGGHSLLAVRLFARIKKLWGASLPVSTLLQSPTIEELSAMLPSQSDLGQGASKKATEAAESLMAASQAWTSLVPIREKGSLAPFFCVAGKGGNPLNLRHLAKRLDPNQPFYGIQHRGVDGILPVHETIEEMAAACISDIQHVQPSGPYLLGGFSGGGLVAFEMAKQLKAVGEEVSLLALFDTPSPNRLFLSKQERWALHSRKLRQQGPKYLLEKLRGRMLRLFPTVTPGVVPGEETTENELPPHVAVGRAWDQMELRYAQTPWNGSGVLFRPYLASPEDVDVFLNEDKYNGWSDFFLRGIEVVELPGGHTTMFEEPHARVLAKRLTRILHAAQLLTSSDPNPPLDQVESALPR